MNNKVREFEILRNKLYLGMALDKKLQWKVTIPNGINMNVIKDVDENPIGTASAYGSVYRVMAGTSWDKYVFKMMIFRDVDVKNGEPKVGKIDKREVRIFDNEVSVGSHQELFDKNVGPRILAFYKNVEVGFGIYVMDSFVRGNQDLKSVTLGQYVDKYGCPRHTSKLIGKLRDTLFNFYTITKGYHGDLHTDNIAVIQNKKTNAIIHIFIFDYGAHVRFKNKIECEHLMDVFYQIQLNFRRNELKENNTGNEPVYYPENTKARVIQSKPGQPYRSNIEMLKLNKHGKIFNGIVRRNFSNRNNSTNKGTSSSSGSNSF